MFLVFALELKIAYSVCVCEFPAFFMFWSISLHFLFPFVVLLNCQFPDTLPIPLTEFFGTVTRIHFNLLKYWATNDLLVSFVQVFFLSQGNKKETILFTCFWNPTK